MTDDATGAQAVIDPGGGVKDIIAALGGSASRLDFVFLTHAHMDHGGKVEELLSRAQLDGRARPKLVAHVAETRMRAGLREQPLFFGLSAGEFDTVPEPDIYAEDAMVLTLGSVPLQLFHAPGHSPGHIVLYFPACDYLLERTDWDDEERGSGPLLFAGDVLFAGSVGRTDLPGGDSAELTRSIREKIFVLPAETIVLSGHGPNTTIGREKKTNPFVRGQ